MHDSVTYNKNARLSTKAVTKHVPRTGGISTPGTQSIKMYNNTIAHKAVLMYKNFLHRSNALRKSMSFVFKPRVIHSFSKPVDTPL